MSLRRRALIAILAGLLLSAALYLLTYVTHSQFFYWPQMIGFYVTVLLRGVHSASKTDYVIIGIPTNAIVFASVIFGLVARRNTPI